MTSFRFILAATVASIAVTPFLATPVLAQETTAGISGAVSAEGAPVGGATVTVTHVPSGTVSTATTSAEGAFSLAGLRIGGPFKIQVSAAGFDNFEATDIFTVVGQAYIVPVELTRDAGTIVVTARSIKGAGVVSTGPAKVLTAEDILNVPSINRDIRDLSRRDAFARLDDTPGGGRAVSFAGQNARFNRFSVDGVPITDNFGLNPDGLPSRRSPIPLDAIGQYQTKVAPYDVREGNFQGGAINIILRSGSNEFQGSGFYSYTDNHLTGKKTKERTITIPVYKSEDYGAQLSGPIIKDKLFFMIAGERIRAGTPIPEGPGDNNAGTPIPTLTQAQVDQIIATAKSKYNYDAGGVLNNSADSDDRYVVKLDANLSETQRASLTFTSTKDSIKFNQNSFTTGTPGLGLESNGYVATNLLYTGVFQLNSEWSNELSSEVRFFYKDYKRGQDPILGRGFAQMQICTAPTSDRTSPGSAGSSASTSCASGFSNVSIGPDVSRQSNALTSNTWGGSGVLRLRAGDHDLRALFDYQETKIFNLFLQRTAGDYYFDSIADFQAGNAQRLRYQNAIPSLDPAEAAARFGYQAYVFGLQDNWRVNSVLSLTLGLRYDMYAGNSRPQTNPNFVTRYGFNNSAYIDGLAILQPRFGFDYRPTARLSIRGGFGMFSGGSPDVYVSNSFSNTGILSNSIDIRQNNDGSYTGTGLPAGVGAAALTGVTGRDIPSSVNTYLLNGSVSNSSPTNALDQDFRLPSQWRSTLSVDYRADLGGLGDGWNFGADLFYSKVRNQVLFTDLRVTPIAGSLTPDGRQRYAARTTFTDTNSDLFLTNTDKGRAYIGVLRVEKSWNFGLTGNFSFTWQDVKDQAPATSSTASSNYANGAFIDANLVSYDTSNDQVKYFFKYGWTFEHEFFGDNKTTIALFGETRTGHPYSFTFLDPASGRSPVFGTIGSGSRYLLYVPTVGGDTRVSYDSAATQNAFEAYMKSVGLTKFAGKIAPRNGFRSPWFTRIDLHVAQEIPTFLGNSKVTLFADIDNFTNLLNKRWGQVAEYAFPYNIAPVRVQCLTTAVPTGTTPTSAQIASNTSQACAQYRYTAAVTTAGQFTAPARTVYANQSLYAIRLGVRVSF